MNKEEKSNKTTEDKEGVLMMLDDFMILDETSLSIIAPPSKKPMTRDEYLEMLQLLNSKFDYKVLAYDSDEDRIADERISLWIEQ